MARKPDSLETLCRELAVARGVDPDARVPKPGETGDRGMPAWCGYREIARAQVQAEKAAKARAEAVHFANERPQAPEYQNVPIKIFGDHDPKTIEQARACATVGNVMGSVLLADGHLGWSQPVGNVTVYKGQISITGVGTDIGCGNGAIKLDVKFGEIHDRIEQIVDDIEKVISFGIGRKNAERVEHELFDDSDAWLKADMEPYRTKAVEQLGTVGGGNHYVDLCVDQDQFVWVGNHFGSRGTGANSAQRYMKLANGRAGMFTKPALVDEDSEIGERYIAAMHLAGRYAFAGRDWVMERIRQIIGGQVIDKVTNHHNSAWKERHTINGEEHELWVVRKGATPCFPGQRGFVGGSMGDDAVILEGLDTEEARSSFYSTIHGAGRTMSRTKAFETFSRAEMDEWLKRRGVILRGGEVDESPMAYRRLPDVLAHHLGSVKVQHTLRPFAVFMAGKGIKDPWKD